MTGRPRVTAHSEIESIATRVIYEPHESRSPGIEVRVDFDLHDHEQAIRLLERAVTDVRTQIEETK